jgi:hypothetical protein
MGTHRDRRARRSHAPTRGRPAAALCRDAVPTLPEAETPTQRETGDRMIGWGRNTFRSQVSAIRCLVRVSRFRCRFGHSVFCPLSSIQSLSHFGWRVAAPGARWRAYSIQPSTQSSTLSSIQSSGPRVLLPSGPRKHVQVSGLGHQVPGTGIQVQVQVRAILCNLASIQYSIQPSIDFSCPRVLVPSGPRNFCPLFHLPSIFRSCPPFSLRSKSAP